MPRTLLLTALLLALPADLYAQSPGTPPPDDDDTAATDAPAPPPPPPAAPADEDDDEKVIVDKAITPVKVPADAPAATGKDASSGTTEAGDEEEEEEEEEGEEEGDGGLPSLDAAPFNPAQKAFLKAWSRQFKQHVLASVPPPAVPKFRLRWRAEVYNKILVQNDQSQGSVTYGTPHPRGDNYSGNNGFASELVLYLDGQVSDRVEVGARIKSRFHRQWADFYENGDLAVDESGLPSGADATGESLGMNHAAYIQLRGLYLRMRPPVPTVKTFHVGSTDLGAYNAWTVGKVRYIDRDNANGLFLDGAIKSVGYHIGRVTLPKLYASAGWNSGIDDPLVQNPFWTRDASYTVKLDQQAADWLHWTLVGSYLLDEEADLNDPDALGSTNLYDETDGRVATLPRYQNANVTAEFAITPPKIVEANLLAAFSYSKPDLDYVFNGVDGNQGIFPIPMKEAASYAVKARANIYDPFGIGLSIKVEYFNIGEDWVATFGARREADVLLTDGFLDGQVPTLNVANEFVDFNDKFYESIVGWHGATIKPEYRSGSLEADMEFTFLEYNTDEQDRCVSGSMVDEKGNPIAGQHCPTGEGGKAYGVYPTFAFTGGMTDTDFFSYANTTDRGRDPRSVYKQNQARRTMIGMLRLGYLLDVGRGLRLDAKVKYIHDKDQRDQNLTDDDYLGHLLFGRLAASTQITDELWGELGGRFAYWDEEHRSGGIVAGRAVYPHYRTWKAIAFLDLKVQFGGATLSWHMEYLNKDMKVTRPDGTVDDQKSRQYRHVVRGLGTVSASF